jgi:hypothetical protein
MPSPTFGLRGANRPQTTAASRTVKKLTIELFKGKASLIQVKMISENFCLKSKKIDRKLQHFSTLHFARNLFFKRKINFTPNSLITPNFPTI